MAQFERSPEIMNYTDLHAEQALEIFERLLPRVAARPEYNELADILRRPDRWHEAHALFNRIRVNITLPTEASRGRSLDDAFVYIAENASKTAYNCSGRSAPFDNDSFSRLLRAEENFLHLLASIETARGEQD